MATIINTACLAVVLFSVISFILSIKRNSTILNRANKNNERTRLKMVVKLCSPLCADVLNRLYIAYVYFVKVQVIVSDDYNCLIIFIVLMPINIITAGLFNMITYKITVYVYNNHARDMYIQYLSNSHIYKYSVPGKIHFSKNSGTCLTD